MLGGQCSQAGQAPGECMHLEPIMEQDLLIIKSYGFNRRYGFQEKAGNSGRQCGL